MLKFRKLKDRIINSKRNSQLLTHEELLKIIQEERSFSQLNISLSVKLHSQVHRITDDNYKIYQVQQTKHEQKIQKSTNDKSRRSQKMPENLATQVNVQRQNYHQNEQITAKKSKNINHLQTQSYIYAKIIELMKEINDLQQRKGEYPQKQQSIKFSIHKKLAEVKFYICMIEDQTQNYKKFINFYNEESCLMNSPDSFHSRDSDQTYQKQSEREAYQLSAEKQQDTNYTQQAQGQIQAKYGKFNSNYESINQDYDDEHQCSNFEEKTTQKSILHLFSYEKDQFLAQPLPCILQRQSQYCSPSSKNATHQNIQFKKINYLLQASEIKMPLKQINQVKINKCTNIIAKGQKNNKASYHEKLKGMINLLQTKYKRKIRVGAANLMESIEIAIKQKNIRPRSKK